MSKRIVFLMAVIACVATLSQATPPPLPAPTNVNIQWNSSGQTMGTVTTPIVVTNFETFGAWASGTFTADYSPGGGPYGGDSYGTSILANVTDGGRIRTDSTRQAYGYTNSSALEPGGQTTLSYVDVSGEGSTADLSMQSNSSAVFHQFSGVDTSMNDHTYGFSSHNFTVDNADIYHIKNTLTASNGTFVDAYAEGAGYAQLDAGESKAGRDFANFAYRSGYNFGWNQDFTGTGTGMFAVTGSGTTEVFKPTGFTTTGVVSFTPATFDVTGVHNYGDGSTAGSAYLQMFGTWTGGDTWSISNHSMTAK